MLTLPPSAGRTALSTLAVSLLCVTFLRGENRLSLPDLQLPEGYAGASLFVHCAHDVAVTAYSLSISHDPLDIRVNEVTWLGTSVAEPDFWNVSNETGEIIVGALLDLSTPFTKYLAPASDHTLANLKIDVLAPAPSQVPVLLEDGLGDPPISNILTDQDGNTVRPTLDGGSVSVVSSGTAPPVAVAGPDQMVAEASAVLLDASSSTSPEGKPLSFLWQQVPAWTVQDVTGADSAQLAFTVPPVVADEALLFRVTVSDGDGASSDDVNVSVIDLDSRTAEASSWGTSGIVLDDGRIVVAFQGDLSWVSAQEDAYWTGMRFTASGAGNEAKLLKGAALHVDSDGDGAFGPSDRQLGTRIEKPADGAPLEFSFFEHLPMGTSTGFFLIVEPTSPQHAREAASVAAAGILLVAGIGLLGRRFGRRRLASMLLPCLLMASIIFPIACGGGGGGAPTVREIQFDLSDVGVQGAESGIFLPVRNLPLPGPVINV